MSERVNPYSSEGKKAEIIKKYIEANFPQSGKRPKKVNLVTAKELSESTLAGPREYSDKLSRKYTENVSNVEVIIPETCDQVEIYPLSSLNVYDTSNPGKGLRSGKYIDTIINKVNVENGNAKVIIMGGDLFGWQWKMAELTKADITEDNKILWFGINIRVKEISKIITKLLKTNAHIILMRGAQENRIMKVLDGRDVIQEVIENVKAKNPECASRLYYVNEGVQEIVQFSRVNSKGKTIYYPIELRTNNALSKATTVSGYLTASQKNNGVSYPNILSLDFNGNKTGLIDADHFSFSPTKVTVETPVGKKPKLATKMNNQVNLYLKEDGTYDYSFGESIIPTDREIEVPLKNNSNNLSQSDIIELEKIEAAKRIANATKCDLIIQKVQSGMLASTKTKR